MLLKRLIGIALLAIPISFSQPLSYLILEGDEVNFSWETRETLIKNASISYEGLFFKSDTLLLEKGIMRLKNASLTTCDLEHPHYKLFAKSIEFPIGEEKRKMLIEGASLYLGNWKVFSLPPFKVSLNQKEREKESAFALPRIELNRSTGFALTESITFNFRNSSGRLKIGYSTKKKFLGRFSLPISPSFNLIFSRYEEVKGKTISPLFISEEPNITWQKGNSSISFGRFFEEPTKQESKRLKFAISRPLLTAKMGGTLSLQISGRGSYSLYEGRESYRALGGEIQLKDNRASSQTNIAIGYLATGGSTPFVFDTEELTSYARLDWRKEGRDLIWELSGIWDLKNAKLYDAIVTLYKKVHCLAPGISWQKRGGIFSFQMKILGFEM